LPDGLFPNQIPSFGTFWKAYWKEILDYFYDHWVYFVAICFIICQFGIFCGLLLYMYYPYFGILY
jgi:hypothetical protein